jgi:teichuronic acid biosynthesis glycosyltransferase TuaC
MRIKILKVLMLSHLYPSKERPAYGVFVHNQVKALIEKGHDIKVICPVYWSPPILGLLRKKWRQYSLIAREDSFEGVKIYFPRFLTFPKAWFLYLNGYFLFLSIKRFLKKESMAFDLIHAHAGLPEGFAGLLLKKTYQVPLVTTIHGSSVYAWYPKSWRCRWAVKKVLRESDTLVVVSSAVKKLVYQYVNRKNGVFIVGNGIPLKEINNLGTVGRERFLEGRKVILSVGALIKRKAHEYLLKALPDVLKVFPNTCCILIGDGRERSALERLTKSLRLSKQVKFLGSLPHRKTLEYMSMCDVFVLSSWDEAFGVVYIEAMAFGKPVIGCKGEGLEDFVKDRETGILVNPKDVESLKRALIQVLSDEGFAQKVGNQAKRIVQNSYTWKSNAERMMAIYQKTATWKEKKDSEALPGKLDN